MKKFLLLTLLIPDISFAQMLDWHKVRTPTSNAPQVYGSHTAGCMDGGIKLPDKGEGYVLGDVHENREYGQPAMINYIAKLGKEVSEKTGRTLIIGDLSSARGGPVPITSSLHQSHQTGLDVDIWFRAAKANENPGNIKQVNMLVSRDSINRKYWSETTVEILKTAASFPEVDRIFVNPAIKKELCSNYSGAAWMSKIRSWWGHAAHFHVRLKCSENNPYCQTKNPPPAGDGCGEELDWWFSDEAKLGTTTEPRKAPVLPQQCNGVYGGR